MLTEAEQNGIVKVFVDAGLSNERAHKYIKQQEAKGWTIGENPIRSKVAIVKLYVRAIIAKQGETTKHSCTPPSPPNQVKLSNQQTQVIQRRFPPLIHGEQNLTKLQEFMESATNIGLNSELARSKAMEMQSVDWIDEFGRTITDPKSYARFILIRDRGNS